MLDVLERYILEFSVVMFQTSSEDQSEFFKNFVS